MSSPCKFVYNKMVADHRGRENPLGWTLLQLLFRDLDLEENASSRGKVLQELFLTTSWNGKYTLGKRCMSLLWDTERSGTKLIIYCPLFHLSTVFVLLTSKRTIWGSCQEHTLIWVVAITRATTIYWSPFAHSTARANQWLWGWKEKENGFILLNYSADSYSKRSLCVGLNISRNSFF